MFDVADVMSEIDKQAPKFGVSPTIAKAIVTAENTADGKIKGGTWNSNAESDAGALGIMQVMPATAKGLQQAGLLPADWKHDPSNLSSQVSAGLAAMKDVMSRAKNPNDPYEIAAGFNGSPRVQGNYTSGNFNQLPAETKQYFTKVRTALMDLGGTTNLGTPLVDNASSRDGGGSSTTSTSSTRTREGDPNILAQLLSDGFNLTSPGGGFDQAAQGVQQAGTDRNSAFTSLIAAISTKGKAAGDAVAAETAVDTAEAVRRAMILSAANLNPGATDNLMNRTMQVVNQTDEQLRAMRPEIDRRMAVGFFDNPIEWMINQTRLPGMVAAYNGVANQQNDAIDNFKTAATIADSEIKLSTGIQADLIAKKGVAKAAEAAATATAQLSEAQVQQATANSRDALTLAQIAGEKVGMEGKLYSATAVVKTEREGETEKQTAARVEAANLENVNRLITAAGGNGISLGQFKMMSAKDREEMIQLASTGKFGSKFSQSFGFQDAVGNRRTLAEKGGLASVIWMDNTQRAAVEESKMEIAKWQKANPGKFPTQKQKEELTLGALDNVQARYESDYATNMRNAKDGNPYKLAYTTWSKDPALANNPLAIFINTYGPDSKEQLFKDVDEKYILDRFTTSIQRGTMTPTDAAKAVSDFYKTAMQKQAMATHYPLYGMVPATAYNVEVPSGAFGMGTSKVDLANPSAVEKFLTMSIAAKHRENFMSQGNSFGMSR